MAGDLTPGWMARRTVVLRTIMVAAIVVVGLAWAKWLPYTGKLRLVRDSGVWDGASILDSAGDAGGVPTLRGGWEFTLTYGVAVWKALLVALVVAAAVETLIPRRRLFEWLRTRGRSGSLAGGLLALPCMMCTCCAAPIVTTLRRNRVPASTTAAYWLGNPVLNPAVIAFLLVVAPWQWALTRVAVGVALVFGFTALLGRVRRLGSIPSRQAEALAGEVDAPSLRRFLHTLGRYAITLVPEYLLVVFALGVFRGWLFPFEGSPTQWGVAAVLVAAVLGTVVVIPTAGEVPILQALALAGTGAGVLGALLICLPAVSLVSIVMVGRALSWRFTMAVGVGVVAAGLVGGGMLWLIT